MISMLINMNFEYNDSFKKAMGLSIVFNKPKKLKVKKNHAYVWMARQHTPD